MDYFSFYGIEEKFFIDEAQLKQAYLKYSQEFHPDYFANDAEAYQTAMEKTSINNSAFKCLSKFDSRLQYILEQANVLDSSNNKIPQDFLMEMMDVNEEIMDLKMDYDAEKVAHLKEQISKMAEEQQIALEKACTEADACRENKEEWMSLATEIKNLYLKRKYVLRLIESVNTFAAD